jgi:alanine dehydrogenase
MDRGHHTMSGISRKSFCAGSEDAREEPRCRLVSLTRSNPNMPGAYPAISPMALTTGTLPSTLQLTYQGLDALRTDPGAGQGVNASKGYVTSKLVAEALGLLSQDKAFVVL